MEAGKPAAPGPAVSVVVPTCARPELLHRCIRALGRQSLPREQFEIVVVDDTLQRSGPAAARNRGWRRALAPVIAFTDDDTEPQPDWLKEGLEAIRRGADVVTGAVVMPPSSGDGVPTDYERDARGLERAEFVTANCFVRRELLVAVGGFDEAFALPWREDSDLQFRLMEAGARFAHAPGAVVVHPVRPAPFAVSLSQQKKVMYDALLYKKHPRLYRSRIRALPRWDYYGVVASLAGAAITAAAGLPGSALLFLGAWLLLTLNFALARLSGTRRTPRHVLEVALTSILIPPLAVFWRLVGALRFRVAFT
jgi:GT2 family glycosyltransferase